MIGRKHRCHEEPRRSLRTSVVSLPSGADRDRTGDPLLAKQVLSQLSYRPVIVRQQLSRHLAPREAECASRCAGNGGNHACLASRSWGESVQGVERNWRDPPHRGFAPRANVPNPARSRSGSATPRPDHVSPRLGFLSRRAGWIGPDPPGQPDVERRQDQQREQRRGDQSADHHGSERALHLGSGPV